MIKILQWNINWKMRPDLLLQSLKKFDAGVLCLQELTQDSEINPAYDLVAQIAGLGYEHRFVPTIDRDGPRHKIEGIGIFSRYPISDTRTVLINQGDASKHDAENYDRAYLEVTLKTPNGSLRVATTHLSYSPDFLITKQRHAETDRLLQAIGQAQDRYILTGDLNAPPDSYVVKTLSAKLVQADPPYGQPTFPTAPFRYHDTDFTAKRLTWRLDYIFRTTDVRVEKTEIIDSMVSDHLPILSTIDF